MDKVVAYGAAGAHAVGVLVLAGVSIPAALKPVLALLLFLAVFVVFIVAAVALGLWAGMRSMYPDQNPIRPPRRMPRDSDLRSPRNRSSRDIPP